MPDKKIKRGRAAGEIGDKTERDDRSRDIHREGKTQLHIQFSMYKHSENLILPCD